MADKLKTLQVRLRRLLKTRDALLIAIEYLAEGIAATIQEAQASERPAAPAGPDWDQALPEGLSSERLQRAFQTTLPARLSSVHRKQEAESNIV